MSSNWLAIGWSQFDVNTPHTFQQLWNDKDFADVTLATVDGQQVRAHKVILSSGSQFFQNIFVRNPHENPLLYLKDIRYQDLELILQYIYTGQCNVKQLELGHFLSVGKRLRVIGLLEVTGPNKVENKVTEVNELQRRRIAETDYKEVNEAAKTNVTEKDAEVNYDGSEQENARFLCNDCGNVYESRSGLWQHILIVHEGAIYCCNICGFRATQQSYITRHIQRAHKGVRYHCNQCEYKATEQSNLTRHIKLVHGEVRYGCNQCEYKAIQQSDLTTHIESSHKAVMYDCNKCEYKAPQQMYLSRHIQAEHEGVMYGCRQCEYTADTKSYLARHIKFVHK